MTETKKSAVPNLQRGMAILEHLSKAQPSATIAEFSERLGYPSASVFRITQELTNLGYLSRDPGTKRFSLTNKLLMFGQPQGQERGLIEASMPAMRGLRKATGETTQICSLIGAEMVILEQVISTYPFKYSAELGARCPAYSCAPGKAIVAHLPEDEREELVSNIRFKRFTPTTITSRREFRKELDEIRSCGYALDRSEGMEGIHCVAAAIRNLQGYPVGAITIAGPKSRILSSEFEQIGQIVSEAAKKIEVAYGQ